MYEYIFKYDKVKFFLQSNWSGWYFPILLFIYLIYIACLSKNEYILLAFFYFRRQSVSQSFMAIQLPAITYEKTGKRMKSHKLFRLDLLKSSDEYFYVIRVVFLIVCRVEFT